MSLAIMKMGKKEHDSIHTSCHSGATTLIITLPRFPDAITLSAPTYLRGSLPERLVQTSLHVSPWNSKSFKWFTSISRLMLTITHVQAIFLHIHVVGSTNIQCVACTGFRYQKSVLWGWCKSKILLLEQNLNRHFLPIWSYWANHYAT